MRRFLIATAAAAALLAGGCKKAPPEHARIDAALAPLLPSDTTMAACLRLDLLKKTPLWDKYVAARKVPLLDEFRTRSGLDPLNDVWELVAATNGKRPLVFVRGKFGGKFGLEPRLEIEGMQRLSYKGHNILAGKGGAVLFLNTGAAVVGDTVHLQQVIDNRDNPKEAPPARLLELVKKVPGGAQLWAVTTSAASLLPRMPEDGPMANAGKVAADLGEGWMHADLSDGVKFHAEGVYSNPESARQINDALRGLIGIGRLRTPDNQPDLLRVYDAITVKTSERNLTVDFNLNPELIDRLVEILTNISGGRLVQKS